MYTIDHTKRTAVQCIRIIGLRVRRTPRKVTYT